MAPASYELSGYGTHYLDLPTALAHRARARAVDLGGARSPADVKKLARVMRLDLGHGPLPSWLGQLTYLRVVKWRGCPKKLPEKLVALPALRELYLEDTDLEDISALAKAGPNLSTICIWRTPLSDNEAALAAQVAKLKGWRGGDFLERTATTAPPKTKTALVEAIRSNLLADGADLTGRDLSGVVIEDAVLVSTKLPKANLQNAIFRRCDLAHTVLDGANLRGARFEDCSLDWRHRAKKIDATGAVFTGGSLRLIWNHCTVADARFANLEPGPSLTLEACDARRMHLDVLVAYESSVNLELSKSDLRGAHVRVDLEASRKAELTKKPNPRLKWKPIGQKGVKTDDATVIEQVPLPSKGGKQPAAFGVDPKGAKAAALGSLHAINAGLWMLVVDAKAAAAWSGSEGGDFDRALELGDGKIKVGKTTGVITAVGDCGSATVFAVPGGLALLEQHASGHVPRGKARDTALGLRIAQWKPKGRASVVGKVTVECGVLALLLPYASGAFTRTQLATTKPRSLDDRFLAPLPNGTYEVTVQDFAPERGFEDEVGRYGSLVRIAKR